ncbi:Non-canonical non-ribosomal peptide synthetase FUB8 [Lasiodiplodia theobromae]|uniref:Non-canonical non-ribosomal peptide synthetase FUB8 n=1 Tax=Lasiodiplodia theobromae TaxID=45133 RepID=A0A5N5CYD1_9PEZI|nr:Non-canonical non-ribosomal peptide synthetase FUB8 [Lasiodiplodia theobromae]
MLSVIPPSAAEAPHVASKHSYEAQVNAVDTDSEPETVPAEPRSVDELMRSRSRTDPDLPLISYPSSGIQYVDYTARQLDIFAYRVAQVYKGLIPQRTSSNEKPAVIGLLGPSNLEYLITMLALTKLGHTVMFQSTRISQEAHASLLNTTNSRHMVIDPSFADMAAALKRDNIPDLSVIPIAGPEVYSHAISEADHRLDTRMDHKLDVEKEQNHVAWIIHSSGSTGLPKPIFQTQRAALKNYATNMNMRGFITLPLFHAHGIGSLFRAVDSRKQIHLYNAALPLAKQYLIDIIKTHDFEIFYGVPYVLNLLAEDDEGLELLARFKIVMFGGSSCPDSLGHKLTQRGVYLVSHYGSTETGQLMTSFRPRDDLGWDYLRPADNVKPFLRFEDRGGGLYECVCLPGWPSKVATNRPDGAYATKDCFTRHPTIPDAWKYYCRLDDTLTLNNGEKANPLQLEGAARECTLVEEAVMFGAGKARLGLALVLSDEGAALPEQQVIDAMFDTIKPAHDTLPAYAKIDRDMVLVLPAGTSYRVTDKGTVIRQAFYKQFAAEIEAMYEEKVSDDALALDEPQLRDFIRAEVAQVLGLQDDQQLSDEQDFFGLGMDSLQTTRLRTAFVKKLDLGGKQLGLNCVFDYPSVSALARHLYALRTGEDSRQISKEEEMQALIEQYSTFREHIPQTRQVEGEYVIVTGATGSLGAHVAAQLASLPTVQRVYCLVRAPSPTAATDRVIRSLEARHLWSTLPSSSRDKLTALPADLSLPDLGLDAPTLDALRTQLSAVIHCAWAVNFNLQLRSFARDCVGGVANLLDLCLSVRAPRPAAFNFCSSVSTVYNTASYLQSTSPEKTLSTVQINEALPPSMRCAQDMGYAQSKLVAETLCRRAAAAREGLQARVLRVGQIVGDEKRGVWNATEAVPLMLRSAVTLGALPRLDESVRWLPVDVVARACVEVGLGEAEAPAEVYNVVNPQTLHWTRELLPVLREAGLAFEEVEVDEWLERLRGSEQDPERNPPVKLLTFWEGKYGKQKKQQDVGEVRKPEVTWETDRVRKWSNAIATVEKPGKELLEKIVGYFLNEAWKSA